MNKYDMTRHKTLAELCVHKDEVIDDLTQQLTEAQAHIERIKKDALDCCHEEMRSELEDRLNKIPEQSLAEHDAEVIEKINELVATRLQHENFPTTQALAMGRYYSEVSSEIDKLRNQANSIGGE